MKPIRLLLTSFGPFVGTHEVDFTRLQDRSFFLIHGPTGSGKTMLLDAMCFALYGESSGGERNPENMRSDFVGRDQRSEVVFEFSLRGKTYRVHRSMRYLRPKERGQGMTEVGPQAELHDISQIDAENPHGVPLASNSSRVTEMVEKLLGFKGDQFRQVVILPQGQFRRLLMADSKDRQVIMEALFQTGLYKRMEEFFKQQAKAVEDRARSLQDKSQLLLNEVECTSVDELKRKIADKAEAVQDWSRQFLSISKAVSRAQGELLLGRQIEQKLANCDEAQKIYTSLIAQREEIDEQRLELGKGQQAMQILPVDNSMQKRRNEYMQAEEDYQQSRAELAKAQEESRKAQEVYLLEAGKDSARQQALDHLQWLQGLSEAFAQHQQACEEAAAIKQECDQARARTMQTEGELDELRRLLDNTRKACQAAQQEALRRELLSVEVARRERELERRRALHDAQKDAAQSHIDLAQGQAKQDSAYEYLQQLRNEQIEMREAWQQGQAAILAANLEEGSPCPVCGSLSHPAPAASTTGLPGSEQIKKKQQQLDQAEKDLDKARKRTTELQTKDALLKDRIRDMISELGAAAELDPAALQQALDLCRQQHQAALQAAEQEQILSSEIERLEETEKQTLLQLKQCYEELNQTLQQLTSVDAIRTERAQRLPETIADQAALRQAQQQAALVAESLVLALESARVEAEEKQRRFSISETRVEALMQKAAEAKERFEYEGGVFMQKLQEAGFATPADYEMARRPAHLLQQLEAAISNYDLGLRSAEDHLKRCQKEAEGLAAVDVAALEERFIELSAERDRIHREHTLAEERLAVKRNRLQTLENYDHKLKAIEEQYKILGNLADIANGKNPKNVTFQRFVLGALLDDVIITASQRLKILSKGRFLLQRSQELTRANAAAGLNITVYDHYTSTARPVANLSGGESFLASLALALGLAEVVQSYAGGTRLDAIFIDEGFGSLDADSLDDAVRILFDLQEQGRLVGIISHIDELKERIDARLEVQKSDTGSSLRFALS